MLNAAMGAARRLSPKLAVALAVIAGAALYAVAYLDPYVALIMVPFFALGCARGKHPLVLLALSVLPALALLAISNIKFFLTGLPLVTYDQYFLRQNVLMLIYNDWRVAAAAALTVGATVLYIKHLFTGRGMFSRFEKWSLTALAAASVACISGLHSWEYKILQWDQELGAPSLRTFVMSSQIPRPQLHVISPAEAAVPKVAAAPDIGLGAPAGALPDIFLVLQESTMHPAVVRPDYRPETLFAEGPLTPNGFAGPLHVHTFGGATWRTEFTIATQMRPQEFGGDGLYVFYQLEGRIKQSIFTRLKALGYRTMVFYPVPGNFINAQNFYASIGVDEFYDPESLGIGKGWAWKVSDATLYDAMLKKIGDSEAPVVALFLTINQHGPHDSDDPIADYVARFAESDSGYKGFLGALEQRGRKAGVVTFGDHQPDFLAGHHDRSAWYSTAYDVRCVNFKCANTALAGRGPKPLDLVMLVPLALEEFGFKLDGFSALERHLYRDCDDDITRCSEATRLEVNTAFAKYFE